MVYLYAAMGVMMLTGIMAIFEMGLSLTGQSLLPNAPDEYLSDKREFVRARERDRELLEDMSQAEFSGVVELKGLLGALKDIEGVSWLPLTNNSVYWQKSCQLSREVCHRIIVREDEDAYLLFSCVPSAGEAKCSFEK